MARAECWNNIVVVEFVLLNLYAVVVFYVCCHESYSKITLDQWRSFLDFSQEFPDEGSLMGYDESESAWPVLIDEYVEFMEKKAKK